MKGEDDTIININLENHANHIYELWDEYGDDVEDEMDFVTDKPLSDDNEYTLIED